MTRRDAYDAPDVSSSGTNGARPADVHAHNPAIGDDLPKARTSRARPQTVRASMLPREHGAYAQLALPILAALAGAGPCPASAALALAACAAFLAHEPFVLLLGVRGARARRERFATAVRWLIGCGVAAVALGACGLLLPNPAPAWTLLPASLAVLALGVVGARRERTLGGELVTSAALSSIAVPLAVAGEVGERSALAGWAVWIFAFAASTVTVRGVVHRGDARLGRAVVGSLVVTGSVVLAWLAPLFGLAVLPMVSVSAALALRPPHPRNLKRVGWALVAATVATAALDALAMRL